MRRAFLSAAVISLLLGSASATVAQTTEPDLAEVHLGAIAALTLAENWQDWRHDGPENAGICLLGNIETDGRGIQISTIKLHELACAAVRGNDDWLVFGIITGTETKVLPTGQVMVVAQGLWCTIVQDQAPLLAGLPAGVP
jgi:hypothetical protein